MMKDSLYDASRCALRQFLMIAPHYPPSGAVAAKRALCFSRHLPDFGWSPAVITLNEEAHKDPELIHLIPNVPLYRHFRGGPIAWLEDALQPRAKWAQTITHPSIDTQEADLSVSQSWYQMLRKELKGLPFDRFAKYIPTQIIGALLFLRKHRCELIYATGGPFSSFILAHALAKLTSLPLILDLRDPYTVDPIYSGRWSRWGSKIALSLEKRQFQQAKHVILNTRAAHHAYVDHYQNILESEHFSFIRNHFDPDLYVDAQAVQDLCLNQDTFKVIFFGHLTPIRNASLFLKGFRQLIDERSLSPQQIKFFMLKHRTNLDLEWIQKLELATYIEEIEWSPFTQAQMILQKFDLLLDLTSEHHYMRISGKLYDYLAVKRPILCISENEEVREILKETGAGEVVSNHPQLICQALLNQYDSWSAGIERSFHSKRIEQYSARPAAQQLANIFNQCL